MPQCRLTLIPVLIPALALTLAGCGGEGSGSQSSGEAPSWFLAAAPAGAEGVSAVKTAAAEGDAVVVRGVIGGRESPMTEGSAVFVMMDPATPSCADGEDDHCPTPWDYCCETPESITANSATVQLVDESGSPLATDLAREGLAPLDEVIVVGTVGSRPSEGVLVIHATGLYRTGG